MIMRVRNVETGEVFERTKDSEWSAKLSSWKKAMQDCGHRVAECSLPSPMPWGHLMFNGKSPYYRPFQGETP